MNRNQLKQRLSWGALIMIVTLIMGTMLGKMGVYASPADDEPEWRGLVEARPTDVTSGEWRIGGRTFTADDQTRTEQEDGALTVNACAEVNYRVNGSGYYAVTIKSKERSECGGNDGGDDGGDGGGDNNSGTYGHIEIIPDGGRAGAWTIEGISYQADAATRFEQEHGGFVIGACVKVEQQGTPPTVTKIETDHEYKCNNSDGGSGGNPPTDPNAALYGVIGSLPVNLIGEWAIGSMTFVADSGTRFDQEHGAFAIGVLVEVKFYTDSSNVLHATQIESKYATDHDGHDDNGNGSHEGNEGHAYGKVEGVPDAGQLGTWTIAGLTYLTNSATRFGQEHGALVVDVNVKVDYYLDASGSRVATKIESTTETGGTTDSTHAKLYGFVQAMPAATFNGAWLINGVSIVADSGTNFQESHGLLAVGAYVEVEYTVRTSNTPVDNYAIKIESQVPPGAGTDNHGGEIETNQALAAHQMQNTNTTWTIGGQQFVVTPATDLNDAQGALTVGSTAMVNSYTNGDGQMVATQIRGVVFTTKIYLPMIDR